MSCRARVHDSERGTQEKSLNRQRPGIALCTQRVPQWVAGVKVATQDGGGEGGEQQDLRGRCSSEEVWVRGRGCRLCIVSEVLL